ncbi:MAG: protein kinase domain-containing protein [Burkholderiaceae bacterium]
MNDRRTSPLADAGLADLALAAGARLGSFELHRVIGRSASGVVYLATDHALALTVAIQEYLPARLVQREPGLRLRSTDPWHEDMIARGLRAFIDEARLLAHCDHPALVRVSHLFEAHGTAYRVMPYYGGRRLLELRRDMPEAPDEASLRALLDDLLGALEAIHRNGRAHGGVTPGNILLLGDDRPLLLGPGAAGREIGSDLVDSLMASLETPLASDPAVPVPAGPLADLCALAEVTRFCITGALPPTLGPGRGHEPLAGLLARSFEPAARPRYSAELLGTLDAALSPVAEDWPLSAAQFRSWLARGAPPMRRHAEPRFAPVPPASAPPAVAPPPAAPAAAPSEPPALRPVAAIRPPAEPLADPMTTDRAPWVAPPVHRTARTRRALKLAMAGVLTLLAVGVLAVVSGAWEHVPAIALDRLPSLGAERPAERTADAPAPMPNPATATATAAAVAAAPAPVLAAPAEPGTQAATPAIDAAAASAPAPLAPLVANVGPASAPLLAPLAQTAPLAAASAEPPGVAASDAAPERVSGAAPRHRAAPLPVRQAGGPRSACASKSDFALYRCMQQQCDSTRWSAHPQCVRLRATDRVD